jgi:hypothetical protein
MGASRDALSCASALQAPDVTSGSCAPRANWGTATRPHWARQAWLWHRPRLARVSRAPRLAICWARAKELAHGRHARIAVYRREINHGAGESMGDKQAGMIGGTEAPGSMCSVNG